MKMKPVLLGLGSLVTAFLAVFIVAQFQGDPDLPDFLVPFAKDVTLQYYRVGAMPTGVPGPALNSKSVPEIAIYSIHRSAEELLPAVNVHRILMVSPYDANKGERVAGDEPDGAFAQYFDGTVNLIAARVARDDGASMSTLDASGWSTVRIRSRRKVGYIDRLLEKLKLKKTPNDGVVLFRDSTANLPRAFEAMNSIPLPVFSSDPGDPRAVTIAGAALRKLAEAKNFASSSRTRH